MERADSQDSLHHSFGGDAAYFSRDDGENDVDSTEYLSQEHQRLEFSEQRKADWKNWGPYVSERAWGTVREDYSADGNAWNFVTHEMSRSYAYRWNEDGLAGVCNRAQNICLGLGLWNEKDPILKERLFGLSGNEGNHGEDVKEYYFYVDSTPTHSYMKMVYKYPQCEFPYGKLVQENQKRTRNDPEYELIDAVPALVGPENRYFDVEVEYAKADEEDLLTRITVTNRNPTEAAPIHVLPQIWYRNTWSWGYEVGSAPYEDGLRPKVRRVTDSHAVCSGEHHLGTRHYYTQCADGSCADELLFTENETNKFKLYGVENPNPFVKDAFHEHVVNKAPDVVNPTHCGSKCAAHYSATLAPGESVVIYARLSIDQHREPFEDAEAIFNQRIQEADEFYQVIQRSCNNEEEKMIQRQAFAGMLWSKQFYHYGVDMWLKGDPWGLPPPEERLNGRNAHWKHLYNADVISMPDKWEYPWYAAWDLAFHTLPIAVVDPEWAKRQLILMLREWYMHPNGQLAAYEWEFSDVNPPVHAMACFRVFKITQKIQGRPDTVFLERAFHKLLINFTWWINRKDSEGRNLFEGGFLGLDNIGVVDRSNLKPGQSIEQADATAWMAMYCLDMLRIAIELASHNQAYEDVATKFFEHFMQISHSMTQIGKGLWDEDTGFFYDVLYDEHQQAKRLAVRSFVGLIPLFAVLTIRESMFEILPNFAARVTWFQKYRPEAVGETHSLHEHRDKCLKGHRLLSIVSRDRLIRVLEKMLDENQFLSPFGIRSLSKEHETHPYVLKTHDMHSEIHYEPAESASGMYGGNSNWRGPVWFPVNFLMIESLRKYGWYYGDELKVECPTGSGVMMNLDQVADELSRRLIKLFEKNSDGHRAVNGTTDAFSHDPHWSNLIPFYEYFNGDNGAGLGASHQTGWTGLVAKLIQSTTGSKK